MFCFFFSSRRRHTRYWRDWSSDVCSSDLFGGFLEQGGGEFEWDGEIYQGLDPVEHPVVRTHPESGEESLFVNAGFTSHIEGLMADESEALLSFLYSHSSRP